MAQKMRPPDLLSGGKHRPEDQPERKTIIPPLGAVMRQKEVQGEEGKPARGMASGKGMAHGKPRRRGVKKAQVRLVPPRKG